VAHRFRSAVDGWWLVVLGIPSLRLIWMLIAGLSAGRAPSIGFVIAFLALAGVWYSMATTFYDVDGEYLTAAFGPVKTKVPLRSIHTLRATTSLLSAPALSARRIEVLSTKGCVMISPKDSAGFVDAIRRAVPGVRIEGLPYQQAGLQQPERGGGN
jgi:hypothetical protein